MELSLARPAALTREKWAFLLYVALSGLTAAQLIAIGRPWGLVGLLPLIFLRPWAVIASAVTFRLSYIGAASFDPIANSQAAFERALGGLSPYGHLYHSVDGNPYPYGPAGLIWWLPGPAIELVAATALLAILMYVRAWFAMAIVAGLPWFHYLTVAGNNDYSPALLLVGGLLLVRSRPVAGGSLIALSAALKPYTAAWFLPAFGLAGSTALITIVAVSAGLWWPVLIWGLGSFVDTARHIAAWRPIAAWQYPAAAALSLMSIRLPWRWALLAGCAVFMLVMFRTYWFHYAYLIPLVAVGGLAMETE